MRLLTCTLVVVTGLALFGLGAASTLALQQPEKAATPPPEIPDFSKMSKKQIAEMMEAHGARSEAHDRLAFMLGKSESAVKMTMGHGVPELMARAIGEGQWALGKRFVITRTRPAPGEEMSTESMNIFGYDTRKNEYFWIGLDTLGTYFVTAFGQFDQATRTFTLYGEETHEGMDGPIRHRMVIRDHGDGTSTSAIDFEFVRGSEEWARVVEITTVLSR